MGGIEAFLASVGVDSAMLSGLRQNAIAEEQ